MRSYILADTSIWIEFFKCREPVFSIIKNELEEGNIVSVEWIFGELLQGAKDLRERRVIENYWENLPKLQFDNVWLEAGKYSGVNRLFDKGVGLIDVAIIVAAQKAKAKIWTLDKKLLRVIKKGDLI